MKQAGYFCAHFLLSLWMSAACMGEPRYLLFNVAPGHDWSQDNPSTIRHSLFEDFANTLPDRLKNPELCAGLSFPFSTLNTPMETLVEGIRQVLIAAKDTQIPIMITLDGQNWWDTRSDLWNWWDPEMAGYNPFNVHNVEWTGWSPANAVKIGWRNWGKQIRVHPAPNIASPRFIDENTRALTLLVPYIQEWMDQLPEDQKHLMAGIKVGWEASIGYNAYYYPDGNHFYDRWPDTDAHDPQTGLTSSKGLSGGLMQLGYAAVSTLKIRESGGLTRDDIGKAVQNYLAVLARTVNQAGIPREKIYTHQGGVCPPWESHLPFWPAMNEWSYPGWSFYWGGPQDAGDLGQELERHAIQKWGAAEWLWGGITAEDWESHLEQTLRYKNCAFVCVYNWNQGGIKSIQAALDGVRSLLAKWKEPTSSPRPLK